MSSYIDLLILSLWSNPSSLPRVLEWVVTSLGATPNILLTNTRTRRPQYFHMRPQYFYMRPQYSRGLWWEYLGLRWVFPDFKTTRFSWDLPISCSEFPPCWKSFEPGCLNDKTNFIAKFTSAVDKYIRYFLIFGFAMFYYLLLSRCLQIGRWSAFYVTELDHTALIQPTYPWTFGLFPVLYFALGKNIGRNFLHIVKQNRNNCFYSETIPSHLSCLYCSKILSTGRSISVVFQYFPNCSIRIKINSCFGLNLECWNMESYN